MMNSIERLQAFKEYMDACDSKDEENGGEKQLIGWGNPLAPILIVGQEPSCEDYEKPVQSMIQDSNKGIQDCFNNGDLVNLFLQGFNSQPNSTWSLYQRLIDYVLYGEPIMRSERQNLPFGTWSFITDMNNTFSKRTKDAEKKLEPRQILFEESRFIHDFPVVLLACGKKYVGIHDDKSDVELIFGVNFDKDGGAHEEFGKKIAYYVHHSDDYKRLVIHTSQITAFPRNGGKGIIALKAIAKLIREHLINQGKFPNFWIEEYWGPQL